MAEPSKTAITVLCGYHCLIFNVGSVPECVHMTHKFILQTGKAKFKDLIWNDHLPQSQLVVWMSLKKKKKSWRWIYPKFKNCKIRGSDIHSNHGLVVFFSCNYIGSGNGVKLCWLGQSLAKINIFISLPTNKGSHLGEGKNLGFTG